LAFEEKIAQFPCQSIRIIMVHGNEDEHFPSIFGDVFESMDRSWLILSENIDVYPLQVNG
jgi:hypothetical protein